MKQPIRVAVTGAAGNIGYALLFRIASGDCFGKDQPVILQLLEIPPAMTALEGVVMELFDAAFPLVHGIETSDDATVAFKDVDAAFLVGSRPRGPGMLRSDLIAANGPIFVGQGRALDASASRDVKVLVVGNPCNTNCLIALKNAPGLDASCFHAMTRLDENRAKAQLANKIGGLPGDVRRMSIWGNHSPTMVPDYRQATIGGRNVTELAESEWLDGDFRTVVSTRGKAIVNARGASSAASAASAAVDHMRTWFSGTEAGDYNSAGIYSDGTHYGIPEGIIFSMPVQVVDGQVSVVTGLDIDPTRRDGIDASVAELLSERETVSELL